MGEAPVEVVDSFCYLEDVVRCEGGAEAAVRVRVSCAWKSWRELASLLVNQNILLGRSAQVYRECVRSMLMYGVETWAMTKQLEAMLMRCDVRMPRYLMGIRWQNGISNEEVVKRSGLEGLEELLNKVVWTCEAKRRTHPETSTEL